MLRSPARRAPCTLPVLKLVVDQYGYNFAKNSGIITWDETGDISHGTHIAGTIAAVNGNGLGVCGIAGGSGNNDGVKIMSLQAEAFDYFIYNAGSKDGVIDGGLVIFASGNEYAAMPSYPGAYPDYICVASTCGDDSPSSYTNYGKEADISAPGGDMEYHQNELGSIFSTMTPGQSSTGYGYMDGTSMACPHVSGVAALGLSYAVQQGRHYNSREFREMVINSARPVDDVYASGFKYLCKNWSIGNTGNVDKIALSNYAGKMGKGVIDARRLLDMIDGTIKDIDGDGSDDNYGNDMVLTNVNVTVGAEKRVDISLCFGSSTGLSAKSGDESVAKVRIEGTDLIVTGVAKGMTRIEISDGTGTQSAFAIVRNSTDDNGII